MNNIELLHAIGNDLGLSFIEMQKISASAPFRYKHYQLPKRTVGYRDIYHPTPELKAIQWWIVQNVIIKLPVHDAVFSYRKNISIRNHANAHIGSKYFLRLDFKNFFPTIKYSDVYNLLDTANHAGHIDFDNTAIALLGRLVCRAPKGSRVNNKTLALSIGAPSSPAISNAILFNLDTVLSDLATEYDSKYSRYADDLYFSTNKQNTLHNLVNNVRQAIADHHMPSLTINENKTSFVSKKHRVQITGVTLASSGGISVGRARKRFIRSQVYKYILGQLEPEEVATLRGLIAFVISIEPDFIDRLVAKYGAKQISNLC